jgi:hypothetical protein
MPNSRCGAARLACEQSALFTQFGGDERWREAPRQPSAEVFSASVWITLAGTLGSFEGPPPGSSIEAFGIPHLSGDEPT